MPRRAVAVVALPAFVAVAIATKPSEGDDLSDVSFPHVNEVGARCWSSDIPRVHTLRFDTYGTLWARLDADELWTIGVDDDGHCALRREELVRSGVLAFDAAAGDLFLQRAEKAVRMNHYGVVEATCGGVAGTAIAVTPDGSRAFVQVGDGAFVVLDFDGPQCSETPWSPKVTLTAPLVADGTLLWGVDRTAETPRVVAVDGTSGEIVVAIDPTNDLGEGAFCSIEALAVRGGSVEVGDGHCGVLYAFLPDGTLISRLDAATELPQGEVPVTAITSMVSDETFGRYVVFHDSATNADTVFRIDALD